jgi:heptosyltransferase-1
MSSMGDIIHTFPALTEAKSQCPDLVFDWVVEEGFADLAALHPAVENIIPIGFRRLRKKPLEMLKSEEWKTFKEQLHEHHYDFVIDAQSLLKSAWIARQSGRPVHGLGFSSAREPLASLFYSQRYAVKKGLPAIDRIRQLFAQVLGYSVHPEFPGYGIKPLSPLTVVDGTPSVFFLHGTAWKSKEWPDSYWQELARLANNAGYRVLMSGGGMAEMARAKLLADRADDVVVLPRQEILQLMRHIAGSQLVIGLDTGLSYLAVAMGLPVLTLYGPTRPEVSREMGAQHVLKADFPCAPCHKRECWYKGASTVIPACYETLPPEKVWSEAELILSKDKES